ncbi:unnamed protein product [Rodentolepis nana]|uniref:GTP-binding protein Di-Ras2 n=1 Tax=Rodentolepis nana TaxID=102285 RepID=A0A0R3TKR4_RODNA|nr:unnamed protein product [Rodentolepis nana]
MSFSISSVSESSTIPDFNVVLFGAAGVGKSALVHRFLKNNFSEMYRPTVEETYSTVLQTMSCTCVRLVLVDTAGLHPFPAMRELRMRTGNAFVFVFSYDSADSLQEAIRLHSHLQRVKGKFLYCLYYGDKFDPKSVIFVGNKADLLTVPAIVEYGNEEELEREDSLNSRNSSDNESVLMASSMASTTIAAADDELQQTARSMIEQLGCPLIETSARLGSNVLAVFHSVLWPMLFAHSNLATKVTPADIANGHFREDSPLRGAQENDTDRKKISWPWRNSSEHSTALPFNSSLSPYNDRSPNRSRFHLERRRKISCVENDMFTGGNCLFAAREDVNRKFSVGSRLLASPRIHNNHYHENKGNNFLSVVNDPYNRPASRCHSADNSLAGKSNGYRDTNSTDSAYSERSYSSLNSVEKENVGKLSVSSTDGRCRHGRFLSPSAGRSSRDCGFAMDLCLHSLDFVQEIGRYLDPSHKSKDVSEPRVPCFQILNFGRHGKSPQPSLNRERVKKRCVFSQSNFCLVDQICEANEPACPRSEHEFNLVVPESHRQVFSQSSTRPNNCKIC